MCVYWVTAAHKDPGNAVGSGITRSLALINHILLGGKGLLEVKIVVIVTWKVSVIHGMCHNVTEKEESRRVSCRCGCLSEI